MKKKKKKDEAIDSAMFSAPPAAARITPEDIQQKEFGAARMGGYRPHEVDEFLDELTGTMGELIQENERLRQGGPPAASVPGSVVAGAGDSIRSFLEGERDFLRALGELVQAHMDQVREMARSTASESSTDEADESGVVGRRSSEPEEATAGSPTEADLATDATRETPRVGSDVAATPSAPPPSTEPIHLGEAQPAASARGDEGGLRELFWGEDD